MRLRVQGSCISAYKVYLSGHRVYLQGLRVELSGCRFVLKYRFRVLYGP